MASFSFWLLTTKAEQAKLRDDSLSDCDDVARATLHDVDGALEDEVFIISRIADYVVSEHMPSQDTPLPYSLLLRESSRDITDLILDGPTYPQIKATTTPCTADVMAAYEFCRSTFGWPLTLSQVERINRVAQKHTD